MNGFYLTDLLIRNTGVPDVDAHFSFIFKIQGFYPVSKKKKVLQKKEAEFENLSLRFQGFFFSVCCIFFSSDNAIATYLCTVSKI